MKIQYELGDVVWIDYPIKSGKVVEIKKHNLIVEDVIGRQYKVPIKGCEPTLRTLHSAKHLLVESDHEHREKTTSLAAQHGMGKGKGRT